MQALPLQQRPRLRRSLLQRPLRGLLTGERAVEPDLETRGEFGVHGRDRPGGSTLHETAGLIDRHGERPLEPIPLVQRPPRRELSQPARASFI